MMGGVEKNLSSSQPVTFFLWPLKKLVVSVGAFFMYFFPVSFDSMRRKTETWHQERFRTDFKTLSNFFVKNNFK